MFSTAEKNWLKRESLPAQPLKIFDISELGLPINVVSSQIPVIYGEDVSERTFFQRTSDYIKLGIDIFGSAFYMLTCYEELVKQERDAHDRFPFTSSIAYQENFLMRPLINEYIEILWTCIQFLWPGVSRKERHHQIFMSHDVDHLFAAVDRKWRRVCANVGMDLLSRRDIKLAAKRSYAWMTANIQLDPYNTFNFIMEQSEKRNFKSAFYFITDKTAPSFDNDYTLEMPWVRKLLNQIHERGHEIGLHPSYKTYLDPMQTKRELNKLRQALEQESIQISSYGGRQHYLRWQNPITWQNWEDAGLDYDSTMGYSEHVGFRCGICYEFPVFNLITRKQLKLRERPLIVMEATLLTVMKKNFSEVMQEVLLLNKLCKQFSGTFTLLWHNSSLMQAGHKKIYKQIIQQL